MGCWVDFPVIYFYSALLFKVYLVKLANKYIPDLSFIKNLNPDKSRKEAIAQWDTLNMKEEIHHVSLKLPVVLVNKLWTKPHHSLSVELAMTLSWERIEGYPGPRAYMVVKRSKAAKWGMKNVINVSQAKGRFRKA